MSQVSARIVVAQTGNPAPGGYTHGSRDGLLLDALVTLTNADNAGVTSWQWEVLPAVGLTEGDYSVSGKESASCTLTPPASTGYGDLAVRLTVRGDPLPNGRANVAVAEALLGVRAELTGYDDGLPIVHPKESTLGGVLTLSALRGVIGRVAEALRALKIAGVGGGGPPSGAAGGDLGGTYPNPTVRRVAHVIYRQGVASPAPGQYATWAAALAAAQALPGRVVIWVDDQDDPPVFPSGTHALADRIEVVGLCASTKRIFPTVTDGCIFQNCPRVANLGLYHSLSAAMFTSTGTGLDLELDNVFLGPDETPGSAGPFDLSGSYNRILLRGGSSLVGGTPGLGTLGSGDTLALTVERGAMDGSCLKGGAGSTTYLTFYPGSEIAQQPSYAGTLNWSDQLRVVLADADGGDISVGDNKITDLAPPEAANDAVSLGFLQDYVDGYVTGLDVKASVRAATTANLLSLSGEQTVDGVSLVTGDRVLVKNQEVGANNGIYTVSAGSWTRAPDANTSAEVTSGLFTFVSEGSTLGGTGWVLTTADPITLGSTALVFAQFSGAGLAYVPTSRQVGTGDGLVGGGALSGDLTLDCNWSEVTPAAITVAGAAGSSPTVSFSNHSHPAEDVTARTAASTLTGTELLGVEQSGRKKATVAEVAFFRAAGTKSIAGSGALSLSASEVAVEHLELTGALTGDRTLTMPSGVRALWVTRSTTDPGLVRLNGSSSGFTHLLPGQTRRIVQDGSGVLRAEASRVLPLDLLVTLTGDGVGDTDHTLCLLPGPCLVDRCEVICEEAVTGGTVQTSVGDSGGYAQLLALGAVASVGDVLGDGSSEAGSAFASNQAVKYASATTLKLRATVAGGTLTAGKVRVLLVARYVGT